MLDKRVDIDGFKATVRYSGPLIHPVSGPLATRKDMLWYGIEWDNVARGKNNGIISGIEYFKVNDPLVNSASLVLDQKCKKGTDILEAIVNRYFPDSQTSELLKHKENLVEILQEKAEALKNTKIEEIKTEFDEDGFIYTFKERTKKIEFMGFDKHWKRIMTLDQAMELGLNDKMIKDFGKVGQIKLLLKSMKDLS